MLIPLGQFLKMLQIKNNERGKDMALKLSVTPAFLSDVCSGREKLA
jgi:hypothetical protein